MAEDTKTRIMEEMTKMTIRENVNTENEASHFPKKGGNDKKKNLSDEQPGVVTRNVSKKSKIQTRAMSSNVKPSASLLIAKKKGLQKKRNHIEMEVRDLFQTAIDSKNVEKSNVILVTDKRMLEHRCLWDPDYPECPERLSSIIDRCNELKLINRCTIRDVHFATKEDVIKMHSPEIYELLLSTHQSKDNDFLEDVSSKYDAVYIHPSTHELSLMAAGSTVKLVEDIVKDKADSGMALIRPPGHHAMTAEPCGYCFYNNVGLAVHHALTELKLSRILIVDWDVHHGQATQQMFYDDPRVVYFSIHRYEHGSFWPNLRQSDFNYIGNGEGIGYNFNVPLNQTKMQNSDYIAIWHQLLLPMALEFQPQLILVSAGYDAALGCPEGEMEITPACYAHLTHMLMGVCRKIVVILEGGYCLNSLAEGAALTLRTLLGDPIPPISHLTPPTQSIRESILNCIYTHKPYWNCFNYQQTYSMYDTIPNVCDVNKEKHTVTVKWLGNEERAERFATRNCYPKQSQVFLDEVQRKLSHLKIVTDLSIPQHRVCYVYDEAMLKHKNIFEDHPERPERISRIFAKLQEYNLLDRMWRVNARAATDEELELAHTPSLITWLRCTASGSTSSLLNEQKKYDSIYLNNNTYHSASFAAGSVLQVVDAVLNGEARSGVCVVRPPGHHASEDLPCGFCVLNNVGIAAKYAISSHSLKRILIIDWDVHHGNGTQDMFINDPRVLYISLHRYDDGTFFPFSVEGNYTKIGEYPGCGFNVNIPWNKRGMGNKEYLAAFTQIILPIAYEFDPELVLISAGFDACIGDPLGGCNVTPECYGQLTHWLSGLAKGKVILCLEGGYNLQSISYAMTMCTKALLGDPVIVTYDPKSSLHPTAIDSINDVIMVHKKYWNNLCFQLALPKENILSSPEPSRGLNIKKNPRNDKNSSTSSQNSIDQEVFYDCCDNIEDLKNVEKVTTVSNESVLNNNMELQITIAPNETDDVCKINTPNNNRVITIQFDSEIPSATSMSTSTSSNSCVSIKPKTLQEYLSENMEALRNEEMFAITPLNWCPHLDEMKTYSQECNVTEKQKCKNCDHDEEIWICLDCYMPACGRYINAHMLKHYESSGHPLVFSLADLSVWCFCCESYVDNAKFYDIKNAAHIAKFGVPMPFTYPSP